MRRFKRSPALLLALFICLPTVAGAAPARQPAEVETVLSGEEVRLKGGKVLRYIGVDAYSPESRLELSREYGLKAKAFNEKLVGGKRIGIEWGPKLRDEKGRLLGWVFTEDGTFVNEELLREGHAKTRIAVPNTRYAEEFRDWEWEARRAKKGIWEKEPVDPKKLKRYIGEINTKVYYLPDSPELEGIPQAQLVTFDSRVSARAAGYKPCFTCRQKAGLDEDLEPEE